ncbi:LADA_0G10858g1_1 [Lachancea dasiensis]|uniref:LADA_0G10858g1_1 n=1 Tax=Lachancea dasiensis TaxID=1072105 RepID=A0A1G4JV20_9SACH|nr:LADA_0G10858g1_1 [Lachancea dasiensis]
MEDDLQSNFQRFRFQYGGELGTQDSVCDCEDTLDIFERFVQDPCIDSWEDLDEGVAGADGQHIGKGPTNESEDQVVQFASGGVLSTTRKGVDQHGEYGEGKSSPPKASICTKCHKQRRWITVSDDGQQDLDEPVLRCSRANSIMSQLSRQASRQSLPGSPEPLLIGGSVEIGPTAASSRSRSRSSFGATSAIPSHLYCLERFVSCELDSAAESFFQKDQKNLNLSSPASSGSPSSPSLAMHSASMHATDTAADIGGHIPFSLTKRRSRVSSIELSLLKSLS